MKTRDRNLIVVVVVMAIVAIGFLTIGKSLLFGGPPREAVPTVRVPDVGIGLQSDTRFQSLTSPRGIPVESGKTGNPNPFPAPTARGATSTP